MAEIVEFRTPERAGGFYTCSLSGDNAGRYVRESDYAALLERHRRLVSQLKYCLEISGHRWSEWGDRAHEVGVLLEDALAEEVDDGPVDNHRS
jgi:hypothetical protein